MCRILKHYLNNIVFGEKVGKVYLIFRDDVMVAEAGHHRQSHLGQLPGDGPHGVQGLLPGEHILRSVREIVSEMRKLG